MRFWNMVKSINDALFDRKAEAEYTNSDRYDRDSNIIDNWNAITKVANKILLTDDINKKNRLIDEYNSIRQQVQNLNYQLDSNITADKNEALSMINKEQSLVKKQSMKRLYNNGVLSIQIYTNTD